MYKSSSKFHTSNNFLGFFLSQNTAESFSYFSKILSEFSLPITNKGGLVTIILFISLEFLFRKNERKIINFKSWYLRWFFYFALSFLCFAYFDFFDEMNFIYFNFNVKSLYKKIFLFFFSAFIILLITHFLLVTNFTNVNASIYTEEFNNKIKFFENSISNNSRINIVIGSSYVGGLNTKSFSKNWTTFNGGGQNIYESFKFIKYYIGETVIDTILIGINPFDFRDTISKGFVNGNSFAFGIDSNNLDILKSRIQNKKNDIYRLRFPNQVNANSNKQKINPKYSLPYLDSQTNLFEVDGVPVDNHKIYFGGVGKVPNMKYFNLFYSLAKNHNVTVVCYFSPKSIYWREGIKNLGLDVTWNAVKDSLSKKDVIIFDLENILGKDIPKTFFVNEDHCSTEGDSIMTQIIKKKLIQLSGKKSL